jgi:hypothetical protein
MTEKIKCTLLINNSIFVVTTLGGLYIESGGLAGHFTRDRSWGWFATLDKAIKHLKEYPSFYHEAGYYNYVVIEETKEGISFKHKEYWFKLKKSKWVACEKPEPAAHSCGWGLG